MLLWMSLGVGCSPEEERSRWMVPAAVDLGRKCCCVKLPTVGRTKTRMWFGCSGGELRKVNGEVRRKWLEAFRG